MTKLAERLFQLLSEEKSENLVLGSDLTSVAIDGLFNLVRVTQGLADWQPIETAPKDGTRILFLAYGSKVFLGEWDETWGSFEPEYSEVPMFNDPDDAGDITHWMPLPDPPKD